MSYSDLIKEAKDFADYALGACQGNISEARFEIRKKRERHLMDNPTVEDLRGLCLYDLAKAYVAVSDGRGGVRSDAGRVATEAWEAAQRGTLSMHANNLTHAQRIALAMGEEGKPFITRYVQKMRSHYQSVQDDNAETQGGHTVDLVPRF